MSVGPHKLKPEKTINYRLSYFATKLKVLRGFFLTRTLSLLAIASIKQSVKMNTILPIFLYCTLLVCKVKIKNFISMNVLFLLYEVIYIRQVDLNTTKIPSFLSSPNPYSKFYNAYSNNNNSNNDGDTDDDTDTDTGSR